VDETQNMKERIVSFIKEKKETIENLHNEARMKQEIVLPLLEILGWNTKDTGEVMPECAVGGLSVDYSLRISGTNKVFIEAKRPEETLGRHEKQLFGYAFHDEVFLAVLTNGKEWWFYLPLKEGKWREKKFCTLDIINGTPDEVASKFIDFLSKENIATNRAKELAEEISEQKKKKEEIYSEEEESRSIYKEYWENKLDDIAKIIREALQYGKSEEIFVSEIVYISKEKGPKKGRGREMNRWYGFCKIQCRGEKILPPRGNMSHMISLGDVLYSSLPQMYPDILQKCSGKTLVFHCKPVGDEENFSVKLWVEVEQ